MWPRGWVEVQLYSSMTVAREGGEWSAARSGRTLLPGKTRYPLYRRLCGLQGRSGRAENLVPTGISSRTFQPIAQSLYWLSYPAHDVISTALYFGEHEFKYLPKGSDIYQKTFHSVRFFFSCCFAQSHHTNTRDSIHEKGLHWLSSWRILPFNNT